MAYFQYRNSDSFSITWECVFEEAAQVDGLFNEMETTCSIRWTAGFYEKETTFHAMIIWLS